MNMREEFCKKGFHPDIEPRYLDVWTLSWQARQPEIDALKKELLECHLARDTEESVRNDALKAENENLRNANELLVKWKGEIDQARIVRGLPFPPDYDESPRYAVSTLIEAENENLRKDAERFKWVSEKINKVASWGSYLTWEEYCSHIDAHIRGESI